ncbi:hypothetical protein DPMN_149998 [Dreissena polymorpha]|uniref:Uncharacterized protein n=1 Tax=Dreissena polymorpha TaxID=45954 RepID=A0A9D4J2Y2_DREPO|nr:hypothetical protein DPMN_149998 [Dreissena polymorpha]
MTPAPIAVSSKTSFKVPRHTFSPVQIYFSSSCVLINFHPCHPVKPPNGAKLDKDTSSSSSEY